ncbi:MAG TPA: DNA internalization-related competence protein ComEC/Rec2, partial [Abditibacteriaceae bacterium]
MRDAQHPTAPLLPALGLRHRPLLPLAAAVGLGCAAGAASATGANTFRIPGLLGLSLALAILCSLLLLLLAPRQRAEQWKWTALLLCSISVCSYSCAQQRQLPPRDDIARLVRGVPIPKGPQQKPAVELSGWVAGFPRRSEFAAEFPLDVAMARTGSVSQQLTGRVWLRVPRTSLAEMGDAITVSVELADLPHVGNPGERSIRAPFITQSCWAVGRVKSAESIRIVRRAEKFRIARIIASWRGWLLRHYETAFTSRTALVRSELPYPRATAQLLTAMVFGEGGPGEPLPRQTRDAFRVAGLSHVLVASGSQVALCAALLLGMARILGLRKVWLLLLVIPALIAYALLAGGAASIWRATVGGLCFAWALLLGRDADGLSLWSLAFVVLLFVDPAQIHDLSFQLSFAAAWGLLVLAPAINHSLARLSHSPVSGEAATPNPILQLAVLSFSAQLATAPLLLYHFGRWSFAGLGTNLIAVPLAGILVTTGLFGLVLPINTLNYYLANAVQSTAFFASNLRGAAAETMPLPLWMTCGFYLLLVCGMAMATFPLDADTLRREFARWSLKQRRNWTPRRLKISAFVVISCMTLLLFAWWRAGSDNTVRVAILDVGQGESIVISSRERTVLIDGGTSLDEGRGEVGRAVIVPYLQSIGVRKIDALILTHADADHCNGLLSVLRELPVALVVDGAGAASPGEIAANPDYAALRREWHRLKIPVRTARAGQQITLGSGANMELLAPLAPPLPDDNNNSVVARLAHGKVRMVLTGDIEQPAEERLVRRGVDLRCTGLKLAHHGSKTSTTPLFLQAAQPQFAVLSCG